MKKNTRYIVATLAAAVVLAGAVTALLLTQPAAEEDDTSSASSTSSTVSIPLISREKADVESVHVKNASGEYTILARTETVSASSSSGSEESGEEKEPTTTTTFYVEGIDEELQNTSNVGSAASYGYTLSASSEIGNAEDLELADFGLEEPVAVVTTTFTDGTEETYSVGNESPVTGTYVLYKDKVYAAGVGTYVDKTSLDFVNTTVLSITPPEDTDSSDSSSSTANSNDFTRFVFTGKNFPEEVTITPYDGLTASYRMTTPYVVNVATNAISDVMNGVESLTADSVAAVNPTDEELEKFGLKDPTVKLKFTVNGQSYTLMSGALDGTDRYFMLDGVDVVYKAADSTIAGWSNVTLFDLRDSFVWLQNIADVTKMTVKTPSSTEVFDLERTVNEESSTEDQTIYEYSVTGTDGQELTYQGMFTDYYQTIIGIQLLDEEAKTEVSGDPMLEVTYEFYEGGDPVTVRYYADGSRRCIAEVDGQIVGVVTRQVVQTAIDNTAVALENKSVTGEDESSSN